MNTPEPAKSWVQLTLPRNTIPPLLIFAARIPEHWLYTIPDKPGKYGIETDPHITAFYGLNPTTVTDLTAPFDNRDIFNVIRTTPPLFVELGELGIFELPLYDVLFVRVKTCTDLLILHNRLKDLVPAPDPREYQPHITLAYMKKGAARPYIGRQDFTGTTIYFLEADYIFPRALRLKTVGIHTVPFKWVSK